MDMDFREFYSQFLNDLHGFEEHSAQLTQMLIKRIEIVVDQLDKINFDSEDCREWEYTIRSTINAYCKAIECYCISLKLNYKEGFDRIDPKKIAEREMKLEKFNEKWNKS